VFFQALLFYKFFMFNLDGIFRLTEWVFDDRTSTMSSLFRSDRERKCASGFTRVIRFRSGHSANFRVVLGKTCSGQHARGSSLDGTGPLGMQAVLSHYPGTMLLRIVCKDESLDDIIYKVARGKPIEIVSYITISSCL